MEAVFTGIGLVSALGESLEASWLRLVAGKSAIANRQPFSELSPRPLAIIHSAPAALETLTQQVVAAALRDAGLEPPLPDCGVAIGSSRSQQGRWEQLGREFYKKDGLDTPENRNFALSDWLETLPHMTAIAAARQIGSTGPVLAPMAACATGIWAIAQGAFLIETGQCQRVIAGAIEAPVTPLTLIGFSQMGALAKTGCYPFDRHREGLVLGEGAAMFVLESAEEAKRRGARVYGKAIGFGLTNDAGHGNAPDEEARGAIAAVKQCLKRAHLSPWDIHYIHAHGTGTQLNDRCEAKLIDRLFPQGVAVSSTKGATGHTLGASGALGAAFCLMSINHQLVPPCVGLLQSEFDLDLVITSRLSQLQHVLCFSFGFGGQNAVLALEKAF